MMMFSVELNKLMQGMSYERYAEAPGLRASDLKHLKRSPAHFKAAMAAPKESTEALEFGKVFHSMVENGEKFLDTYKVEPVFEGRTKKGELTTSANCAEVKEKRASWYADLPKDAVVVKTDWVEPLTGMCRALKAHRLVGNLIKDGVRESSLWVEDPETGVTLKCRPDFISSAGFLVDFKTARNAHPDEFIGHIFDSRGYFYALQFAHYCHCLKVARLGSGESATIVAIEKEPPYGVKVYALDVGNLAPGEQWRHELTKTYAECLRTDKWPGYGENAEQVLTPEWVRLPQ